MKTFVGAVAGLGLVVLVWSLAVAAEESGDGVTRGWEYKVVSTADMVGVMRGIPLEQMRDPEAQQLREADSATHLNDLGAAGWELIEVEGGHFYFKRPRG